MPHSNSNHLEVADDAERVGNLRPFDCEQRADPGGTRLSTRVCYSVLAMLSEQVGCYSESVAGDRM